MTPFNWLQIALAVTALAVFVRRFYRLAVASAVDTRAFLGVLAEFWTEQQDRVAHLFATHPRAAVVGLAAAVLGQDAELRDGDLVELELRRDAVVGIGALRTIGRIASPLAFAGVMFDLAASIGGGHGLEALQRGLAEQLALERAMLAMCIGVTTSLFCFAAATRLQALARERFADLRLAIDVVQTLKQG